MNLKKTLLSLLLGVNACFAADPTVGVAEENRLALDTDRLPALTTEAQWKVGEPIPQGAVTIRRYFNVAEGYASPLVIVHVNTQFSGKDLEKFLSSFLDAALKSWGSEHKLTKSTKQIGGESFLVFRIEGVDSKNGTDGVFYCTSNGRTLIVTLIGTSGSVAGYCTAFESGFSQIRSESGQSKIAAP